MTKREKMSPTQFDIVTICGSMRYWDQMLEEARLATQQGYIVLMPFVAKYVGGVQPDDLKKMLDDMHFTKISMSDYILVVGEHIGESTRNEINYAKEHNIPRVYTPAREVTDP